ncbi:hypothetical protein HID58_085907, partial [Brassica napus]
MFRIGVPWWWWLFCGFGSMRTGPCSRFIRGFSLSPALRGCSRRSCRWLFQVYSLSYCFALWCLRVSLVGMSPVEDLGGGSVVGRISLHRGGASSNVCKSLIFKVTAFSIIYRRHSRCRPTSFAAAPGPIPMEKRKPPKRASPPKLPAGEKAPTSQNTASESNLQDPTSVPVTGSEDPNTVNTVNSAKVISVTDPAKTPTREDKEEGEISPTKSNLVTEKEDAILDTTRNSVLAIDPQRHSTASLKESASSFKNMENRKTSGKVDSSARGSIDRASSDHGRSETSAAESDSSNLDSSDS